MLQLAVPSDLQAVNALAAQLHAPHVSWRPDLFAETEQLFPPERFAEAVKQRQLYVFKLEGTVVGYTVLKMRTVDGPGRVLRRVMQVSEFVVEALCRRHGIGTEMMADIRILARAFGCTDLELTVYPQNDEAVAFYQKCGFTIRTIGMQTKI